MVLHIYGYLKAAFYLYIKKDSRHLHAKYNFENLQINQKYPGIILPGIFTNFLVVHGRDCLGIS